MTIIKTDGTFIVKTFEPGTYPTLKELQEAVGGYIETVPGSTHAGGVAYCNENGRLENVPMNPKASRQFNQVLVGDVVVLEPQEVEQ